MATRKPKPVMSVEKAVAVRQSSAVVPLSERMAGPVQRQREELAKTPTGGGKALSFKGGTISLDGNNLGNSLPVVILATQFERTYFAAEYSADSKAVPSCYSRDAGPNAGPAEGAAFPQSDKCSDCHWNQFETAHQGKGKGCKEGLKVALVAAANLDDESAPPMVTARFSVLNTRQIQNDLRGIFAQGIDHTVQAHVNLTCQSDPKKMIDNHLIFTGPTAPEVVERLEPLIDDAQKMLCEEYPKDNAVDPEEVNKAKAAKPKAAGRQTNAANQRGRSRVSY